MAKYEDNKDKMMQVIREFEKELAGSLSLNAEYHIKKAFTEFPNPPIDTGTLRRSITADKQIEVKGDTVTAKVTASTLNAQVGKGKNKRTVDIEYAGFIEFGTIKMAPRPFMRNGIKNAEKGMERIINRIIKRFT